LSFVFLLHCLDDGHGALAIDKVCGARSARDLAVNAVPLLPKVILDAFQAI